MRKLVRFNNGTYGVRIVRIGWWPYHKLQSAENPQGSEEQARALLKDPLGYEVVE